MKQALAILISVVAGCSSASEPPVPIKSGEYTFQHRFAKHPTLPSFRLKAKIEGSHIVLTISAPSGPFPAGVLAEGELMWHAGSKQWIIGSKESDRSLEDVGGCSDGPEVVDLVGKVYWTC